MPEMEQQKYYLLGIDDTDNADSRGTGFMSRQLAHQIMDSGIGKVDSITRHQLYVHKSIRYTSQNSSACLKVFTEDLDGMIQLAEQHLQANSANGSDAGMCISQHDQLCTAIITWGNDAKNTVLTMEEARIIADTCGIYLKGFTGNFEGIIGALAAVGLRAGGNDGRFIWRKRQKELRDLDEGVTSIGRLKKELDLDGVISLENEEPGDEESIFLNKWVRPILKNDKALLIVEKNYKNNGYEWELTPKEVIRTIS